MDASRSRRSHRSHIATICASVLLGATRVAVAGAQDLPLDIVYHAQGASCPSRDEFLAVVQEAVADPRPQQTRDERQFTVILEDDRGVLEVRSEGGPSTSHEVRGSSCSEVGSALALSLALAIAPSGPPEDPPAIRSSQDTSPQAPAPAPTASGSPTYAIGLATLGVIDTMPPALGGMLFYDLPHSQARLIAPRVRVGAALLQTVAPYTVSVRPEDAGSAYAMKLHWQWYLVRAEMCGVHITTAMGDYGLRLCAAMAAGYIVSQPSALSNAKSSGNPWLAPELGMRAFAEAFGVVFELGTGLSFPLTRYRYFVDASGKVAATDVYQIQPIGWTFLLGVSYQFP